MQASLATKKWYISKPFVNYDQYHTGHILKFRMCPKPRRNRFGLTRNIKSHELVKENLLHRPHSVKKNLDWHVCNEHCRPLLVSKVKFVGDGHIRITRQQLSCYKQRKILYTLFAFLAIKIRMPAQTCLLSNAMFIINKNLIKAVVFLITTLSAFGSSWCLNRVCIRSPSREWNSLRHWSQGWDGDCLGLTCCTLRCFLFSSSSIWTFLGIHWILAIPNPWIFVPVIIG